ncbi:hypothetical protein ACSFBF_05950 [Variovorax sp. ZT5P49]|uniref:hypothetical protein n=1 Tax=Variovorax sp. ZT5P49 TaxID=3443733 RepID=UPI003F44DF12
MAHLIAARDFIAGMKALETSGQALDRSLALLAGQAVESLLEGYILASLSPGEPSRDGGHDLEKLWTAAASRGLGVPTDPPSWLKILAQGHRSPFPVRYQAVKDKGIKTFAHGSSYAPMSVLVQEIPKLESLVAQRIETHQRDNG